MGPWLESLAAAAAGVAAFFLGRCFSRLPKPWWIVAYAIPLAVIVLYCAAMFVPGLALAPPVSWLTGGRSRFVCFNVLAMLVLSAPLDKLPQRRTRRVLYLFMLVLTAVSVVPFLAPAFNRSYLAALRTRIDADSICRQSNDYTCGPAAAVTALRKLGFPAEEGEIAILAHANALTGTEPDVLAAVLQERYGPEGLIAEYRAFRKVEELKAAGLTIAVIKFNALQDHCVTVLGVEGDRVLVGDPLNGLSRMSREEFESKWLYAGIVLRKESQPTATPSKPR